MATQDATAGTKGIPEVEDLIMDGGAGEDLGEGKDVWQDPGSTEAGGEDIGGDVLDRVPDSGDTKTPSNQGANDKKDENLQDPDAKDIIDILAGEAAKSDESGEGQEDADQDDKGEGDTGEGDGNEAGEGDGEIKVPASFTKEQAETFSKLDPDMQRAVSDLSRNLQSVVSRKINELGPVKALADHPQAAEIAEYHAKYPGTFNLVRFVDSDPTLQSVVFPLVQSRIKAQQDGTLDDWDPMEALSGYQADQELTKILELDDDDFQAELMSNPKVMKQLFSRMLSGKQANRTEPATPAEQQTELETQERKAAGKLVANLPEDFQDAESHAALRDYLEEHWPTMKRQGKTLAQAMDSAVSDLKAKRAAAKGRDEGRKAEKARLEKARGLGDGKRGQRAPKTKGKDPLWDDDEEPKNVWV